VTSFDVHSAAMLFPLLEDEELRDLADDIRKKGLLHAIVLWEGKILDGRNRKRACELAGVEPHYIEWSGMGDPTDWVIATNLYRRHLTTSQRALIAVALKKTYAAEIALARSEAAHGADPSLKRGSEEPAPEGGVSAGDSVTEPAPDTAAEAAAAAGKAAEKAARRTHVSRATVERAQQVVTNGSVELVDAVRSGDFTISAAAEVAKLPAEEQRAVVRDRQAPGGAPKPRRPRLPTPTEDTAAAPLVDFDQASPLKLSEFKAEYKRGPRPSKRTPLNEVPRLRQIEVTTQLVLRAWRWINMEWDTDQREDMRFALADAKTMTPLIEQFAERIGQLVFVASGEKAALEAELREEEPDASEEAGKETTG
jgi:ParB-like chromosome segregation protein Spo0J